MAFQNVRPVVQPCAQPFEDRFLYFSPAYRTITSLSRGRVERPIRSPAYLSKSLVRVAGLKRRIGSVIEDLFVIVDGKDG
ncbi:hypothetical protein EVAR_102648_1 [Eumeta japonica]|uniref:Uncharacterized protein n=1 Tax=Eumeta variegata TaxID=151549 RepID=A0A4C1TUV2_EUMVA|nr:hypothetical protein EVAR_102648_1 [Eumeta japonica]